MNDLDLAIPPWIKLKLLLGPVVALGFVSWLVFVRLPGSSTSWKLYFFAPVLVFFVVTLSAWNRRYVFTRDTARVRLFFRWTENQLPRRIVVRVAKQPQRIVSLVDPSSGKAIVSVPLDLVPEAADALVTYFRQWQPDLMPHDGAA